MSILHQVTYGWQRLATGPAFGPTASTLAPDELGRLHRRVEHWLRTDPGGSCEVSHFYGVFGRHAVLVRREQPHGEHSALARLLVSAPALLTPRLALEVRDWQWLGVQGERLLPLTRRGIEPYRVGLAAESRSPEALAQLVPLLSHVLAGEEDLIELPPSECAYPLLWGLDAIVGGLVSDEPVRTNRPPAFETFDDRARPPGHPGLFIRFSERAGTLAAHPVYDSVAGRLVADYARRANGAPMPSSPPARPAAPAPAGPLVPCPICAATLTWDERELYRYDRGEGAYVTLTIPDSASPAQRAVSRRTAFVRCAGPEEAGPGAAHYLPLAYGQHGTPSVYGFVGATNSGKTHLLISMIAQLEKHGLGPGLSHQAISLAGHQSLVDEQVSPFLNDSRVVEHTRPGAVGLVDIFMVREAGGGGRPVALFDVAGGDLLEIESARRFLDVADGLIFVVNAAELGRDELGDRTFATVLELLQASGRLAELSTAIVLGKADLLRFEDPIASWLRQPDRVLDPDSSLRESADVYAYLQARHADAWTRPYRECRRATFHVASAAGSDTVADKTFVRGVRPCRVLNPLIALMAMTGVLTSPEARRIGI
ncbi:hypothetical protein ACFFV7_01545 [Nonomuraea spiralis]|uniref:Double-GTPase 2 domain-containing protein n=1 Tax=Nonomuraea spiralis TaxID=46182 RepID=A0ABV5I5Y3_9ACTN|nr:GTPase domain-containing protein [Nonomuraea spiralis]GGS64150.1 hypothetical protein GCM10010176_003100 [Nonomuraea spiralis]